MRAGPLAPWRGIRPFFFWARPGRPLKESELDAEQERDDSWIDGETKVLDAPSDHGDQLRLWLRLLTCSTLIETQVRRRLREEFDFTLPRFDMLAQLEK